MYDGLQIVIRAATRDDYAVFAMLFRELGIDDPIPTLARWLSDLMSETLISEREGCVEGYVSFYMIGAVGHVRNLVVAPAARRAGVGLELMRAAAGALRARGADEWHLNVKCDNAPAIRLYEGLGFAVEHRSTVVRMTWAAAAALPADVAVALPVAPAEDDDIERALGLLPGRIAMSRMRADRVLVQLRDEQCAPVGYAMFDPSLGAHPFRVARPALAGTLLAALRPHARAEHVQLVVEDDAALVEQLVAVAAERRLELLHYRGLLQGSERPVPSRSC